ncbi:MAG: primosomal protein N' [Candidatus Margulisbacteria bacterium]|nr:primosomal protein N' [Candidatus Margulisiibacteriota bacterium]
MFAEVLLSKVSPDTDKTFTYAIPERLNDRIGIGSQVVVPFGRRKEIGYVVERLVSSNVKGIKEIIDLASPEPIFSEKSVKLARWMADYYLSFFLTALRLVMPPGLRQKEERGRVGKLVEKGKKGKQTEQQKTNTQTSLTTQPPGTKLKLTPEQQTALDEINQSIDDNKPTRFLLHGVTGSGKTEVYMQAIAHLLEKGQSAIVLVPEISLTPQMVQRFTARFQDHIAVLHSELTLKKRNEEWQRIVSGQVQIVLGARSAVFAPLKNLGLIIIDEEYENTYKSDKSPRYHTREVAFKLAALNNAVVVLGSATPSIETYFRAEAGEYKKIVLPKRIDDRPLPPVTLVDMREELKAKNFSVLSRKLQLELKETLDKGEQAILFMNRLGYFTFVMCRECGLTIECPNCSVSLVYHSGAQEVRCAKCGYAAELPKTCPRCNSTSIKYFGTGTQRIEDDVAKIHPSARILRYDRDTVGKRGSHEVFFSTFAEGNADVLIGTQMVAKGLDVAKVTLVGVVSADTALNLPDYQAAEHTFQMLTQVAGRAGRHHLPGKVIIQTYNPEHYAIKAASTHDYEQFYRKEIEHRRSLNYPPFSRLISIIISSEDQKKAIKTADDLGAFISKRIPTGVLGPAQAAIARLRGEWRYHILIKGNELRVIRNAVNESIQNLVIPDDVRVTVDVEPTGMM